jgi:uncharacterized cupin superfamily protein
VNISREAITIKIQSLFSPAAHSSHRWHLPQTRSTHRRQTTTATEQPITVTGTIITTTEEGSAANYQPAKTLVVREDRSNTPGSYVLNGPGHVVNKNGDVIQTAIKPGTHVRVYYVYARDLRVVDHVVVD